VRAHRDSGDVLNEETDIKAELEEVGALYRDIGLSIFTDVILTIPREGIHLNPKP
jgi:hypothetical protein